MRYDRAMMEATSNNPDKAVTAMYLKCTLPMNISNKTGDEQYRRSTEVVRKNKSAHTRPTGGMTGTNASFETMYQLLFSG